LRRSIAKNGVDSRFPIAVERPYAQMRRRRRVGGDDVDRWYPALLARRIASNEPVRAFGFEKSELLIDAEGELKDISWPMGVSGDGSAREFVAAMGHCSDGTFGLVVQMDWRSCKCLSCMSQKS
jgi:hypothetical protein